MTWDDCVSKFVNQFYPPSRSTSLRNDITQFQQAFNDNFSEAWERFKGLLRKCPHRGFLDLHQIDTFYNGLNLFNQDSLNSVAGGDLLSRSTQEALVIIENKAKARTTRNKTQVLSGGSSSSQNDAINALTQQIQTLRKQFASMQKPVNVVQVVW
ncbi:reverse transcriptase domain-containing protein [Tanacetum coccineum]